MNIEDEIERLTDLKHLGMALLQFSRSLRPGTFKKKRAAWIYSPNFVGFEIRYARVQRLNILVRPVPMPPIFRRCLLASTFIVALIRTGERRFPTRGSFRLLVFILRQVGETGTATF